MTYFDWNATAPLLDEARDAWLKASESAWANPSVAYRVGVQARLELDEARDWLAGQFGVDPEQVIFTSGATEACNGFIREAARRHDPDGEIWVSAVDHPAVQATALEYWGEGRVRRIPVLASGELDLDWLESRLQNHRPSLVCVMAVNNETGVIQPWQAVAGLCQANGVPYFCDAVQWMGKLSLAGQPWLQCAGIAISGHKFGGPKGVGCLILGPEWRGVKVQTGGSQEHASRSGTENIAGVVSMVAALRHRNSHPPSADLEAARDNFERDLLTCWEDAVILHGAGARRVWNTCSVALPGFPSNRWIARLDRRGFQVSAGSACSTGKAGPSPVLTSMNVPEEVARRTVRISGGWETRPEDWGALLVALKEVHRELEEPGKLDVPGRVIRI
ncbi:MAG: cysteine desulfurase family protein [Puniceicoccaceae bacterium]